MIFPFLPSDLLDYDFDEIFNSGSIAINYNESMASYPNQSGRQVEKSIVAG